MNLDQNFKHYGPVQEIYNLYQANERNVDIITITKDLLVKIKLHNKDLLEYSKETVQMFTDGLKINYPYKLGVKNEKILITGGAGYVGSLLSKKLVDQGNKVVIYDTCYYGQNLSKKMMTLN